MNNQPITTRRSFISTAAMGAVAAATAPWLSQTVATDTSSETVPSDHDLPTDTLSTNH